MPRWKRTFESPCEDDAYITYHYVHFRYWKRFCGLKLCMQIGTSFIITFNLSYRSITTRHRIVGNWRLKSDLPTKDHIVYSKEHDLYATVLCERTGRLPCQFVEKGKSKLVKTRTKRIMWYAASRNEVWTQDWAVRVNKGVLWILGRICCC